MWNVFDATLPVFGLILVGYLIGFCRVLDKDGVRGLSRFAFRILIPVMLGRSMAILTFAQPIEWTVMVAYFGATLVLYGVGMGLGRWLFSHSLAKQAVFGLGTAWANLVVLGVPIVLAVHGTAGELPMYMIISLNAAILFLVATSVLAVARGMADRKDNLFWVVLKTQFTHPVVLGLATGLFINLLGFGLVEPLGSIAEMLASAAPACALFALGASLSLYSLEGSAWEVLALVLVKNLLHPAVVYVFAFLVFDLSQIWGSVAVILAAQPMGINTYLFADDTGILAPTVGTAFVLSTVASIVSTPAVLYFLS